jgi:hypothetical protein
MCLKNTTVSIKKNIAVFEKTALREYPSLFSKNWLKLAYFEHLANSELISVQSWI